MFRLSAVLFSVLLTLSACTEPSSGVYEGTTRSGNIASYSTNGIRLRHLDSINAMRVERGLQALQLSAELNSAAATHARDMSKQQRAWNFGSDRTSPQERAERAGFIGVVRGENVAESFRSEFFVLQAWLDNTVSRASIFDPELTHVGYAWYQESNGKVWWVEVLAQSFAPETSDEEPTSGS